MEIKPIMQTAVNYLKKYRYVILIFVIGFVLMILPSGNITTDIPAEGISQQEIIEETLERRLEKILSTVEGAGEVQVILTVAAGEETLYQTNEDRTTGEKDESIRLDTVTITDTQRNEQGLIKQVVPAIYKGAVVVCQGADKPSVQLALVDAVSKLTGLGANNIAVLKMK